MTMRIYQSTDASAPTLQGVVGGAYSGGWADGSLLNLLDKILVVGYGSMTAAGWTRSFTGTSKGVFRQGAGCGFYIRVLDDGSLTAGAREAQFYGGETASDVDTLTQQFPTSTQQATYLKFRKSNKADTTQRSWLCFADDKTFHLHSWSNQGDGVTDYLTAMSFGDFHSVKSDDAYNCYAWARDTSATLDNQTSNEGCWQGGNGANVLSTSRGAYVARGYSQAGGSVRMACFYGPFMPSASSSGFFGGPPSQIAVPNPSDAKIILSRAYFIDITTAPVNHLRGWARGVWAHQHLQTAMPRELNITGVGTLAGKTLRMLGLNPNIIFETTDTWD